MLVLSRKLGETIHIGDDVSITVVRLNDYSARIGVTAPKNVPIARGELLPPPRKTLDIHPEIVEP